MTYRSSLIFKIELIDFTELKEASAEARAAVNAEAERLAEVRAQREAAAADRAEVP